EHGRRHPDHSPEPPGGHRGRTAGGTGDLCPAGTRDRRAVMSTAVIDAARAWHAQDPDEATRAELALLIEAADGGDAAALAELTDRFGTRLAFGTAGLRGRLGAGSNRMNRVLVSQAASGLAAYLLEK